jgi:dCMP deaminase
MRPTKAEMFMRMAEVAALRSTCKRAAVGAIITDASMLNVLAIGYNGPPRRLGNECPDDASVAGGCGCIHAEVNALLKAPFGGGLSQTMFITDSPCLACARLIINSGVNQVVFRKLYRLWDGVELLTRNGIVVIHLSQ